MKKNNVLLRNYKSAGLPKLKKGGFSPKTQAAVGAGAELADGVLTAVDPMDKYGTRTGAASAASGALKGAAAGAALGPVGAIAGGVIGLTTSFIANKKAQKVKQDILTDESKQAAIQEASIVDGRIANDPTLQYGNTAASMYKFGGTVKGVPSTKFSIGKSVARFPSQMPDLLPDVSINPGKMNRLADGGEIPGKPVPTPNPNVLMTTKRGNKLTKSGWEAIKSKGVWNDPKTYMDWVDGWGNPTPDGDSPNGKAIRAIQDPFPKNNKTRYYKTAGSEQLGDISKEDFDYINNVAKFRDRAGNATPYDPKATVAKMANGGSIYSPKFDVLRNSGFNKWRGDLPKRLQSDKDYDLEGYYNTNGATQVKDDGHLSSKFKKPNHVTFSDESVYSNDKTPGGQWSKKNNNWAFKPSQHNIDNVGADSLKTYFKKNEPKAKLIMAKGGVIPTSSTTSIVKGPSHAEGGVKFPDHNVELEGDETLTEDNFVFSKDLGFAEIHDKLGRRMGRNERKPDTVLNKNTQKAMVRKEGFLKIYQEQTKKAQGLPNEIDNTAAATKQAQGAGPVLMRTGGQMPGPGKPKKTTVGDRLTSGFNSSKPYVAKAANYVKDNYPKVQNFIKEAATFSGLDAIDYLMNGSKEQSTARSKATPAIQKAANPLPSRVPLSSNNTPIIKRTQSKSTGTKTATKKPLPSAKDLNFAPKLAKLDAETIEQSIAEVNAVDPNSPFKRVSPIEVAKRAETASVRPTAQLSVKPIGAKVETDEEGMDVGKALQSAAPFVSNLVNAFRRMPMPSKPTPNRTITPSLINLDASRAEAVRERRGADKTAAESLNGNNQVAAVKAANLTQQIRETNRVNETETNANIGIKNQALQVNAGIEQSNNLKKDFYNNQLVERQLKQQEVDSANLADAGNKVQAMKRDKATFELEEDKMLLTFASDPTESTLRAGMPILKRRMGKEALAGIEELTAKLSSMNAEDRKAAQEMLKIQIAQGLKPMSTNTTTNLAGLSSKKTQTAIGLQEAKTGN